VVTDKALKCKGLNALRAIMDEHENIISTELNMQKIKDKHFADFDGSIKSLGAWGGDFCMVATDQSAIEVNAYFKNKGLDTVISYDEMCLSFKPQMEKAVVA